MQIPEKLVMKHKAAEDRIEIWIAEHVQKGTIVRWKKGKHKGRKAEVTHVRWNEHWHDHYTVRVDVKTERLDGKGYLDDSDYGILSEDFEPCE